MYRIENRPRGLTDQPALYWNRISGWETNVENATPYTAREREGDPTLPDGGVWVLRNEPDEAMTREIDTHDEHLRNSIESGCCPKCQKYTLGVQINPKDITFLCGGECGWSAIYPIRTLGNSERAERDETLDLTAIAEREVIAKAKAWAAAYCEGWKPRWQPEDELLAAVTLLESREVMNATDHLEEVRK